MNASAVRRLAICVLLLGLSMTRETRAADDDPQTRTARTQFERGETAYNLGHFDQALTAYQAAYEAKPLPGFLFNVAQCYRNLGNDERALFFYRRYLTLDPETRNRAVVEQLIDEAEKRLAPRAEPAVVPPKPSPPASPPPLRQPSAVAPPPLLVATSPPPATDVRPVHRRWWFWTTIGGVVLAGTATALLLSRGNTPTRPTGDLGAIDWN